MSDRVYKALPGSNLQQATEAVRNRARDAICELLPALAFTQEEPAAIAELYAKVLADSMFDEAIRRAVAEACCTLVQLRKDDAAAAILLDGLARARGGQAFMRQIEFCTNEVKEFREIAKQTKS
ncbi:MAG: hypothetical protein QM783_07355 [Phycisphaerales bacterium]